MADYYDLLGVSRTEQWAMQREQQELPGRPRDPEVEDVPLHW